MKDISKDTLSKIKQENIKPKAPFWFVLGEILRWIGLMTLTVLGSLAITMTIFLFFDLDWDLTNPKQLTFYQNLLLAIPYFWISLFVIFLFFSIWEIRQTKNGYRFPLLKVLGIIIGLNIIFGTAYYALGADQYLHQIFYQKIPFYQKAIYTKQDQWSKPDSGLLSGKIEEVSSNDQFILKDFSGKEWETHISDQAKIAPMVELKEDEEVKIIGKKIDNQTFQANELRPWNRPGMKRLHQENPSIKGIRCNQSCQ